MSELGGGMWIIARSRVPIEQGQMGRAVLNVLQNAVEAVGGEGSITVRLHSRNGRPTVIVDDTCQRHQWRCS